MGVLSAPEIREWPLSVEERAKARDCYVREFDRQFREWSEIARCCCQVDRDQDWKTLGFSSFHAWLKDAAPASRSYIYLVMGRYQELIADIPEEELKQIPLGSAGVLVQMSKSARRDPQVRNAAKKKPKEFIEEMQQVAPEQHLETRRRVTLDFYETQWSVIEATFEKYQVMFDSHANLEGFIEWLCSEVSEWSLHVEQVSQRKEVQ